MIVDKRIELERVALHARLDKWIDYVERVAPGIDERLQSTITFSGVIERVINDEDVEFGTVRVEETRREEV